jgi:copper homeostasis protein
MPNLAASGSARYRPLMSILIEACVDTVDSSVAAEQGGAGRLELCAALGDAGTTPSAGMIRAVRARVRIPVVVIIRPRGGGFVYSNVEMDVMRRDIENAREAGAEGVAIGALTPAAEIDVGRTLELVKQAGPMPVTFHRAFDLTRRLEDALESLIYAGITRVLTSGGSPTAVEGADVIASLRERAAGRIRIMAGGGIREENVTAVVRRSGVSEIHVRGTRVVKTEMFPANDRIHLRKAPPEDDGAWEETDVSRIRALVTAARGAAEG